MTDHLTADNAYQLHAALVQARAWFEHFREDVAQGLTPYPDSIEAAISAIDTVIGQETKEPANV